jgi:hypothetical protein
MSPLRGNRSVPVPSLQAESEFSVQHPRVNSQYGQPILPGTRDEVPASKTSMMPSRAHVESELKGKRKPRYGIGRGTVAQTVAHQPKTPSSYESILTAP